ncbi:2-hydroxychromene-2-carboxylate isomerase [Aestuariibacter salexigens]|uniref:2-hydroxychromene-2-carboxylate isomerase n=1 Tax=Aestuariibacter salexigens TaxID=226010 RepID=UPI000404F52B|nr:DsbA family protein [Aestuariibacter salexigens]
MSTQINWYFDIISPFAYLQWQRIKPMVKQGKVQPVPILFAGVLNHIGHLGPAEIPSKRTFVYQHSMWLADRQGIPFTMPPAHPFNPLTGLRVCIAYRNSAKVIDCVFNCIWQQGLLPDDEAGHQYMSAQMSDNEWLQRCSEPSVKAQLKDNTEKAIEAGVFGVPTAAVSADSGKPKLFWGADAHDMLLDYLQDKPLFSDPDFRRLERLPQAAQRK